MDDNSLTEITRENWFSRINRSIKGILLGLILFIAAFPLLWWNEGRSVERYNSLMEGQDRVISVSADEPDPANNARLVHVQGLATTKEVLHDAVFGISVTAIKLLRQVSMYQWQEHKKTEIEEKVGGTKETRTTYSYHKTWLNHEIDSNQFKRPGYDNPSMFYSNKIQQARKVTLGAFQLNPSQVSRIDNKTDLSLHNLNPPDVLGNKPVILTGNSLYLGDNPDNPQIGDMKVNFQVVYPSEISLIAKQQSNNHFSAYQTEAGGTIDLLQNGIVDANTMFTDAQQKNTVITWVIRAGGTFMMWIGLGMVFRPLTIMASIFPLLGNLIGMGTGLLSFLVTLPCAMITIALAWITYRPLLATGLIAIALLAVVTMKFMPRDHLSDVL